MSLIIILQGLVLNITDFGADLVCLLRSFVFLVFLSSFHPAFVTFFCVSSVLCYLFIKRFGEADVRKRVMHYVG